MIEVEASITDSAGGSDAAYDLCGRFTPEQFAKVLAETLGSDWGLTHAVGEVSLSITITKVKA